MIKTRAIFKNEDVITNVEHDAILTWFEDNSETTEFYDVEREILDDGTYILIREWPDETIARKYIEWHKEFFKDNPGYIGTELVIS